MKYRILSTAAIVVGIFAVAAAAVLHFVLVPAMSKMPDNLDVTARYTGTATMLDAQALQRNDLANMVARDVPITAERHIYVSSATSDRAVAHDDTVVTGPGGLRTSTTHTYGVDRTSLEAAPAPAGVTVEPHTGYTVSFPADPPADDSMSIWHPAQQATVPVKYKGSGQVLGRDVRSYVVSANGPVKDPATLATLPPVLPAAAVTQMLSMLSSESQQALNAALPAAGPVIPVSYRTTDVTELSLDIRLGLPVDGSQQQQIVAIAQFGDHAVDLMPVMETKVTLTGDSKQTAADQAKSVARQLTVISVVIPLVCVVLGLALIAAGVFALVRRARNAA